MRVLIGCEESATVRDAFRRLGHDAWSCDIVESRGDREFHLIKDIMLAITDDGPWDIIVLHPPCTALAVSGNRWYGKGMPRNQERLAAIQWTCRLWELALLNARIGCALENPVSVIWEYVGKPDYIQPWQFGHGETKATGILTHNLPPLSPTNVVDGREQRVWKMPPGPNRKRDRSKTFQGVADAMAAQWGALNAG